jgi:hypothetical protein
MAEIKFLERQVTVIVVDLLQRTKLHYLCMYTCTLKKIRECFFKLKPSEFRKTLSFEVFIFKTLAFKHS